MIGVFTEWGKSVGGGHISRCERLLEVLDSQEFWIYNNQTHISTSYMPKNSSSINWLNKQTFTHLIKKCSHIIIDSYLLDDSSFYEIVLGAQDNKENKGNKDNKAQKKLLILDDYFRTYPKDAFVLNGALNAQNKINNQDNNIKNNPAKAHNQNTKTHAKSTQSIKSAPLKRFFGAEFNLANQIFKQPRITRDRIQNVFVMFGASDKDNLTQQVLHALESSPLFCDNKICLHIILGAFNANHPQTTLPHRIYRNVAPKELCEIMTLCDIAICAGGQSLYELALNALPTIIFIVAQNQLFQANAFSQYGMKISTLRHLTTDINLNSKQRKHCSKLLESIPIGTQTYRIKEHFML